MADHKKGNSIHSTSPVRPFFNIKVSAIKMAQRGWSAGVTDPKERMEVESEYPQ